MLSANTTLRAQPQHELEKSLIKADSLSQVSPEVALKLAHRIKSTADKLGDCEVSGRAANRIGFCYSRLQNFQKAQEYYFKALNILEACNVPLYVGYTANNIGMLFYNLGQLEKANQYYKIAHEISTESENKKLFLASSNNLGIIHHDLGQFDSSNLYFELALPRCNKRESPLQYISVINNIVNNYIELGQLDSALSKIQNIEGLVREIPNEKAQVNIAYTKAYILELQGASEDAFNSYIECLDSAQKIEEFELSKLSTIGALYCATDLGKMDTIIPLVNTLLTITEDEVTRRTDETIFELETKYEVEKKERELELTKARERNAVLERDAFKRSSILIGVISILSILVLIGVILTIRYRSKIIKQRLNQVLSSQERDIAIAQLEAADETRQRISRQIHDEIGGGIGAIRLGVDNLLSQVDNKSDFNLLNRAIESTAESARRISHNLADSFDSKSLESGLARIEESVLSNAKLKTDFQVSIKEGINIPGSTCRHIYSIVQELIINTLRHANAKSITLHLTCEEDAITLLYFDDGIGVTEAEAQTGIGTFNIQERVQEMNGQQNVSSSPKNGYRITINIPLK